jgi:hypothetical protein
MRPVGYGYESIEAIVEAVMRVESAAEGLAADAGLEARRRVCEEIDARGLLATPANSSINELVVEAARESILADGLPVRIIHGRDPRVEPRGNDRLEGGVA